MAFIEKRRNSDGKISYRARVRLSGAPKMSQTFRTRKEAEDWAHKLEAEIKNGRYFRREEDRKRTFNDFIERYIEKELPKNPDSYKKQKQLLTWWRSHLGRYFLCHITPSMIAELRDKLMSEKNFKGKLRSASTCRRYIFSLSKAYTICTQEWQWTKENPVAQISKPKENKPKDRYLEKEEIGILLSACQKSKSPHVYAFTLFSLGTGARKGEVLDLLWEDVDFFRSTATFRDTKNSEDRTVHLNKGLLECLMDEYKKRLVKSKYVFPSKDGKKPADIKSGWERVVQISNFKDVTIHTLRHTVASHLAMSGFSPLEIGRILGHKSLSMIKRYSHLSTASTERPLDKLSEELIKVA